MPSTWLGQGCSRRAHSVGVEAVVRVARAAEPATIPWLSGCSRERSVGAGGEEFETEALASVALHDVECMCGGQHAGTSSLDEGTKMALKGPSARPVEPVERLIEHDELRSADQREKSRELLACAQRPHRRVSYLALNQGRLSASAPNQTPRTLTHSWRDLSCVERHKQRKHSVRPRRRFEAKPQCVVHRRCAIRPGRTSA
jgi:hypothetical protein